MFDFDTSVQVALDNLHSVLFYSVLFYFHESNKSLFRSDIKEHPRPTQGGGGIFFAKKEPKNVALF